MTVPSDVTRLLDQLDELHASTDVPQDRDARRVFDAVPDLVAVLRAVLDATDGLDGWRDNALRYADHSKEDAVTAGMARARALAYERATARIREAITDALEAS